MQFSSYKLWSSPERVASLPSLVIFPLALRHSRTGDPFYISQIRCYKAAHMIGLLHSILHHRGMFCIWLKKTCIEANTSNKKTYSPFTQSTVHRLQIVLDLFKKFFISVINSSAPTDSRGILQVSDSTRKLFCCTRVK